jgi:tetratricopeptide (TPR) repeat protein
MAAWGAMLAVAVVLSASPLDAIVAREQAGDDAGALALAESWAAADPRSPYGHLEAARLGLKLGQNLEAVDHHLRWAYALAPDNPRSLHLWGLLEEERGDIEGARAAQRRALALRSDYLEAHVRLAALAQRAKDWAEAERELRVLIAAGDRSVGTRLQLASVQEKGGHPSDAERTLTELHRAEPKNAVVTRALADLYQRTGRTKQAQALLKSLDPPKRSLRPLAASRR